MLILSSMIYCFILISKDSKLIAKRAAENASIGETKKSADAKGEHRKIEYTITRLGKETVKKWLAVEAEKNNIRDEFILKLFYSANIDSTITIDHVRKKIYDIKSSMVVLENTKKELAQYEKNSDHYIYWDMSADYGLTIMKAKLHWCESVIKRLKIGEK